MTTKAFRTLSVQRFGILLMCAVLDLCLAAKASFNLYLHTATLNESYMWFITNGFWYSPLHFGAIIDEMEKVKQDILYAHIPIKSFQKIWLIWQQKENK